MAEIKTIQTAVHKLAHEKGWHDGDTTLPERLMLVVCEISEAVECIRDGELPIWQKGKTIPVAGEEIAITKVTPLSPDWKASEKPEGTLIELADAVIRIFDICESQGWDLEKAIALKHTYNKTRPYRHGGKAL
jgi:hypothetical protein